jgi:hypothetical protein
VRLTNTSLEARTGQVSAVWEPSPTSVGAGLRASPPTEATPVDFTVAANGQTEVSLPLNLPAELPDGRTWSQRLFLLVQSGEQWTCERKRAVLAPVVEATPVAGPPIGRGGASVPALSLGEANLALGQEAWNGPRDLSASFRVGVDDTAVYVVVEVQDDHIVPEGGLAPPFNDCVEVFLDLRPPEARGQPVCTPQVLVLFLALPTGAGLWPRLYALEKPPASLEQFGLVYTPTPRGYVFQLTMPRAALAGLAGGPVESFGFDVAVDDADQPGQRKAQMIWAGVAENFINPRYFGEISLRHPAPGNARLTVW